MRRAAAIVIAAAALGAMPASALAALSWDDAGAGAPASVTVRDLAAGQGLVVAVGSDSVTGASAPAIYRLAGGNWHRDTLLLPVGESGELTAVAVSNAGALAIGTWKNVEGDPTPHPLLVSLDPAALTTDLDAVWTSVRPSGADPLPSVPASLALEGGAGVIGAADGQVYRLSDDAGTVAVNPTAVAGDVPSTGPLTGVALFGGGHGLAVGNDANTGVPRFFSFDSAATSMTSQLTLNTQPAPMRGLAAVDSTHAIAIDQNRYWDTDGSSWTRRNTLTTATLRDIAIVPSGDQLLAGDDGPTGSVWRRNGSAPWTRDDLAGVNAVAIAPTGEHWAAGDHGLIRLLVDHPPPPPPDPGSGGSSTGGGTTTSGGDPGATQDPSTGTASDPGTQSDPGIAVFISQPPVVSSPPSTTARPRRAAATKPAAPKVRLVQRVAVKSSSRGLIVTFTLTRAAKVALVAKRAGRVVGQTAARRLKAGRRQIVLPYSGNKPPTQLKIIARPAGKAGGGTTK